MIHEKSFSIYIQTSFYLSGLNTAPERIPRFKAILRLRSRPQFRRRVRKLYKITQKYQNASDTDDNTRVTNHGATAKSLKKNMVVQTD